ncbi:MAG: hypothetical protein HUK14_04165 [Muribaculaceae bacterium]|nr:hypothetical protein [Muribaculaceae bacterium]
MNKHISLARNSLLAVILLLCAPWLVTSCDSSPAVPDIVPLIKRDSLDTPPTNQLQITKIDFSAKYDTIRVFVNVLDAFDSPVIPDMEQLYLDVYEKMIPSKAKVNNPPDLLEWFDMSQEISSQLNLNILMLVDLTLPTDLVEQQRRAVRLLSFIFNPKNMQISFMYDSTMTDPVPLTDYAVNNYFVSHQGSGKKLYRSILDARDIMLDIEDSKYKNVIVMSDGSTYNNDMLDDDEQFSFQEELTNISRNDSTEENVMIHYVNFDNSAMGFNNDAQGVMMQLAANTNGTYMETPDIIDLKTAIKTACNIDTEDYLFVLYNPDDKVYYGKERALQIEIFNTDGQSIISNDYNFTLGTVYRPVIVGDTPLLVLTIRSIAVGLLFLFATYLALQLIYPYIRYRMFKKKNIFSYTGDNMAINNNLIGDTCYICKDKFEVGDTIVAKCEHTSHYDCWVELGHHCPEYGRHCPKGSFYYNRSNIFDPRNAPSYAIWVYFGLLAAIISWLAFTNMGGFLVFLSKITAKIIPIVNEGDISVSCFVGLSIGFFFTLAFAFLALRNRPFWMQLLHAFLRAVMAGVACYIIAVIVTTFIVAVSLQNYPYIGSCINTGLCCIVIVFASVWRTPIVVRYLIIIAAAVIGVIGVYIILFIFNVVGAEYHYGLLTGLMITGVLMSLCISHNMPRSERFFLSARGAIKPIDIALYKWFITDPKCVVSIGKSIDCSICLSWEIIAPIAPLEAEITNRNGHILLLPIEPGVMMNGKELPIDKHQRLYHGSTFSIGNTTFTYIEKDL